MNETDFLLLDKQPSEGIYESQNNDVLPILSDFHFSRQSLPTKSDCIKKYLIMLSATGGGLAYWDVTDAYNAYYDFPVWEADSNVIGVTVSAALFLLQSVDLAKGLLEDLAGFVPERLEKVLEVPPASQRKKIKRRTFIGSSISGVPFLIIALNNPLPPIKKIVSDKLRKGVIGLWGGYVYIVNVGLHLLPIAVLQSPQFSYYRPFPSIPRTLSEREQTIARLDGELKADENELRTLIADRLSYSFNQLVRDTTADIQWQCRYDDTVVKELFSRKGTDRLLYLLEQYPPPVSSSTIPSTTAKCQNYSVRLLGAQLQLGAGFTWWTNVFPALFQSLKQSGTNIGLAYALTGLFGAVPSYTLIVILAFFGEMQIPRLVDYVINASKKIIGKNKDFRFLPPESRLNPVMWSSATMATGYITAFSSVNAKSVNEAQYRDSLPDTSMDVLAVYADIGISILTFIALMDLYYRYQTEVSAVFGASQTHAQLFAHLLVIQEKLPKDIRRAKPEKLLQNLKKLTDTELQILLGPGKDKIWLQNFEEKINAKRTNLRELKQEEQKEETPTQNRQPKPLLVVNQEEPERSQVGGNSSGVVQCLSAVLNCFLCCRRKPRSTKDPLLVSSSREYVPSS